MDQITADIQNHPRFHRLMERWRPLWKCGQIDEHLAPVDMILAADTVEQGLDWVEETIQMAEIADPNQLLLPF